MTRNYLILILKIACFCLFAGRAWQHLVWDIPIRALLWDQELMEGIIVGVTSMTWQEYATSPLQDTFIQTGKVVFGIFYLACAILCFFITEKRKWIGNVFLSASFFLIFLAFLYYKERFFHLGQLLEYTTQIVTPILLYLFVYTKTNHKQIFLLGKIAIALTFICHGLYAVGYYPQPGNFVDMVIKNLFIGESTAKIFLMIIGVIDIVLGIAIFIPVVWRAFVWYAFIWGILTAVARISSI